MKKDNAGTGRHDEKWMVQRQDDNGNRFLVEKGLSREEAERLVREYEARGHKQFYWAEVESQ